MKGHLLIQAPRVLTQLLAPLADKKSTKESHLLLQAPRVLPQLLAALADKTSNDKRRSQRLFFSWWTKKSTNERRSQRFSQTWRTKWELNAEKRRKWREKKFSLSFSRVKTKETFPLEMRKPPHDGGKGGRGVGKWGRGFSPRSPGPYLICRDIPFPSFHWPDVDILLVHTNGTVLAYQCMGLSTGKIGDPEPMYTPREGQNQSIASDREVQTQPKAVIRRVKTNR